METQATTFKRLLVAENCKADDLRRERDALRSQRDALAEALRFCVKALEVEAPIYKAHIDEARAALALADGAE